MSQIVPKWSLKFSIFSIFSRPFSNSKSQINTRLLHLGCLNNKALFWSQGGGGGQNGPLMHGAFFPDFKKMVNPFAWL